MAIRQTIPQAAKHSRYTVWADSYSTYVHVCHVLLYIGSFGNSMHRSYLRQKNLTYESCYLIFSS